MCDAWPQVSDIGGGNPEVICDVCTREQMSIPDGEVIGIWVRIEPPKEVVKAKPKRTRKPPVKTVRCSLCQQKGHIYNACPLIQEPLFNGA